ncbi:putative ATP-grasp domain containing protein [Lyophyllum shimeji]|uniref:ATP-grasp domain containing protein n=1 Tax=Lyophyllum shimeji TaxID=47721 RepID=A0A9P3UV10_LYOSH|nr:putative ATP-grasp domain containing protein [Lyophyllum shimeji]
MREPRTSTPLNILLTNGRFPTSLDLARQLKLAGHRVYVVDCMHYHVCKFSIDVKKSYRVPVQREDPSGFVRAVKNVINEAHIDRVIPMHEEIFVLARAADTDEDLRAKLFAPDFKTLVRLHNKWEFWRFLRSLRLEVPQARLCKSYEDVLALDICTEWAVKPVFGRATTHVFHLRAGEHRRDPPPDELDVGPEKHYIAQEWLYGDRYCTYGIVLRGRLVAFAIYPVKDTIDGSSCVYFQANEHAGIRAYVDRVIIGMPHFTGQLAFDFIEVKRDHEPPHLVCIECNPRATSGIHLFSGSTRLALAITSNPLRAPSSDCPVLTYIAIAVPGTRRQLAPGMLMWKRTKADHDAKSAMKQYVRHMKRLMTSRDVMFSWRDLLPSLMQPFLLTSYYVICHEKGMRLPVMFQWDVTWEPQGRELEEVRRMFEEEREEEADRQRRWVEEVCRSKSPESDRNYGTDVILV